MGKGRRLTLDEREARLKIVRDAIDAGTPATVIAQQLGIAPSTVTRWARYHGLSFPYHATPGRPERSVQPGREPGMTVAAAAAANRETGRPLHPRVHREPGGWELHCDRCGRTPVRVYPSRARAEKARALHDRCCEGVDTTIRGRAA